MLFCKRCDGQDYVKNGIVRGHQRYLCTHCGCNFTGTKARGKHPAMKAIAVLMYAMGGMSMLMIGRFMGVSDVTIGRWIKAYAADIRDPQPAADTEVVMVDEMWTFVNGKKTKLGCGVASMLVHANLSPNIWVGVMTNLARSS